MSRPLFSAVVARPAARDLARSRWSAWPVSLAAHSLAIGGLFLVPLVSSIELPVVPSSVTRYVGGPELPPPPPPVVRIGPLPDAVKSMLAAPFEAPEGVRPETGVELNIGDVATPDAGPGIVAGPPMSLLDQLTRATPPPPPLNEPVRPGVLIVEPRKTVDVPPLYPPLALAARVEGVVIIEAVIGTKGDVEDIRVLRSVPLLDQAALDAVRQWRYTPTLLNGVPVRVIMTVTVHFKLKDEV